jgi:hypothetical protein
MFIPLLSPFATYAYACIDLPLLDQEDGFRVLVQYSVLLSRYPGHFSCVEEQIPVASVRIATSQTQHP